MMSTCIYAFVVRHRSARSKLLYFKLIETVLGRQTTFVWILLSRALAVNQIILIDDC